MTSEMDIRGYKPADETFYDYKDEEEREVWKEMKEHFKDRFEEIIQQVLTVNGSSTEELSPEQKELRTRLELLEKRKKEKGDLKEDMW